MQRVIIVEDSKVVQQVLRHLAAQWLEIEVDFAWSLREAAGLIKHHKYALALVDLTLPDAPDGEVVKLMMKAAIPTVVLTSAIDEYKRLQMIEMGVIDYVLKDNRDSYLYAIKLLAQLLRNQGSKVLVADDSKTSRNMMRQMLEQLLYQVVEAADGEEALEMLCEDNSIKLLLTDFAMPKMDGFELAKAIRHRRGRDELAIIGISASGSQSLSAKFIKYGANDFLIKPFMPEEFHCRVMQTMEQLNMIGKIKDAANRDYLTNLYNRRYFYQQAQYKLKHDSKKQTLFLAMLDIDYFKQINDTYGHQAGDEVLVSLSSLLQQHFPETLTARLGGEEFAVVFEAEDNDDANELMDEFRFFISNRVFSFAEQPIAVSISIGIAAVNDAALEHVIQQADLALYDAKGQGRNQVVFFVEQVQCIDEI